MGGVDLADQYRSYYQVGRASRKWWRYIFWFLVQTAMCNSYLVIKTSTVPTPKRSPVSRHLLFRMKVLDDLLIRAGESVPRSVPESPSVSSIIAPKTGISV
ncbi:PiggyBac transposable element-derived protein 4-like [Plakobranchus ocellatus]|uniref:PiggyBac transposable element-derived protein 4-like n=1 Tax=Plakobranchus ocellatus TaxID=259542 RepID=A0AAV4BIC5_9GAST|nr:PiggyBac transposable element-derived protein 4-like [Plakobranchus ocellatus]